MKWLWLLAMALTGGTVVVSACGGSVGNVVPGQDASLVGATDTGAPDILTGGQEASGDDGSGGVDAGGGTRDAADASDGAIEAGCDTQFDPRNCGVCGHDCAGGSCSSGICVPLPAGVLASGQRIPSGIAVDATSVYWVTQGEYDGPPGKASGSYVNSQLLKCATGGCNNSPTVLASALGQSPAGTLLVPVAIRGSNVYWGASLNAPAGVGLSPQVMRCAVGGCNGSPSALWSGQGGPTWFAIDANNVYFVLLNGSNQNMGQIAQCPVSGCGQSALILASSPFPFHGITADATNVYWTDQQARVLACAIGGCSSNPTVLASGQTASAPVVSDGTHVYWTNGTSGSLSGPVMQCPIDCKNNPVPLTTSGQRADGLAVDATNAYWTQPFDGLVLKCALSGCSAPTIVASGQNGPCAIAVDDKNVYWTNSGSHGTDGEVRTSPK